MSNTSTMRVEDIMTDFQFKSIIKMALSIAESAKDKEAIINELSKILPEDERGTSEKEAKENK